MSEFIKRSLTGIAFVIIMLGAIIWSPVSLFLLLIVIATLSLYEYFSLFKSKEPLVVIGISSGMFILSLIFLERQVILPHKFLYLLLLPFSGIWFLFFLRRKNIIESIIVTVSGMAYILIPLSLIPFLTQNTLFNNYDPGILLGTLIIIWVYDSGAYISGVLFGKHKMAPRFSPKKSWEGLAGGTILAFLASVLISKYFVSLNITDWMVLSILIVGSSTIGDLFESHLKRKAGIKDSGKILPGHGGIMDRFDSVFFAIPFVFLYVHLFKF